LKRIQASVPPHQRQNKLLIPLLSRFTRAQDRFHAVVSKRSVIGKQNQTLGLGLSNEKPIEGLPVMQWQLTYRQSMGCENTQRDDIHFAQQFRNEIYRRFLPISSALAAEK
jgi:hypothetical protein